MSFQTMSNLRNRRPSEDTEFEVIPEMNESKPAKGKASTWKQLMWVLRLVSLIMSGFILYLSIYNGLSPFPSFFCSLILSFLRFCFFLLLFLCSLIVRFSLSYLFVSGQRMLEIYSTVTELKYQIAQSKSTLEERENGVLLFSFILVPFL